MQKDRCTSIHAQTHIYCKVHYIDIKTHRDTDRQIFSKTDRQIRRDRLAGSRQTGGKADRNTDKQKDS